MNKLLVANWKSNPLDIKSAVKLTKAVDHKSVVIAPPFHFLDSVKKTIRKAGLGAQDVFWKDLGASTGEISWRHLKASDVKYVIIGHSERRRYLNESDELINKKVTASIGAGLKVILCVGEPISIRRQGIKAAKKFVKTQLTKDLRGLKTINYKPKTIMIAYEPIWAIGTGHPDTPKSAVEMSVFIKRLLTTNYKLQTNVLYGGSVNAKNAHGFLSEKSIDGALIGGASLNSQEFKKIIDIASGI